MSFPNTVNPQAIRQVIRFVTQQDTDKSRLALAAYEIEGYGLGLLFPGAAYIQDGLTVEALPPINLEEALRTELAAAPKQGPIDWLKILAELKPIVGPLLLKLITDLLLK